MNSIESVIPRVYISNAEYTNDIAALKEFNINAILTCGVMFSPWCNASVIDLDHFNSTGNADTDMDKYNLHTDSMGHNYTIYHLTLKLFDALDVDITQYIEPALNFITGFLSNNEGNLLIHCFAGQSRSASIYIAYMMSLKGGCYDDCLNELRDVYPKAGPNVSFERQLRSLTPGKPPLVIPGNHIWHIETTKKHIPVALKSSTILDTEPSTSTCYKCRMCSFPLFYDKDVLPHQPTMKDLSSPFESSGEIPNCVNECSSVFVDEVGWIIETMEFGMTHGVLNCPKCYAKLGTYSFYGSRCSCGSRQTPAYQFHYKRIDRPLIYRN